MGLDAHDPQRASRSRNFIGRVDEMGRLERLLSTAAGGAPTILIARGEAGVGKSRMLIEFADRARKVGARVLIGSCIALGTGEIPYAPLVEALRRLVREVGPERAAELGGRGYDELVALISDLTGDPDTQRAPAGPTAQTRVFGAVLRMLDRLGEDAPVMLIIEDLQWADPSTLDLLKYLAPVLSSEKLLLVASYRTTDLPPRHPLRILVAELELARRVQALDVPRFGRSDLKTFLRATMGVDAGHDLIERAAELSDGNALLLEELISAGVLTVNTTYDGTAPMPRTIRDLMLARLAQLDDNAREVMRVAGTAGRRVSHGLLAAVCDMTERALSMALRVCVDNDMLIVEPTDGTYVFRHALLREVVHQDLLPRERSNLHRAIAVALAGDSQLSYAQELTVAAELSYHWLEAQAFPEALAAAVRAGEQAMRILAFREAGRQYDRALAVWPRLADPAAITGLPRPRLLILAADAARWGGRIDRAVELARKAVSEVDMVREPVLGGEMYERLGSYLWEAGEHDASELAYDDARLLLADAPPSDVTARLLAVGASKLIREGHHAEGLTQGLAGLAMAETVEAPAEQGRALNWIGVARALQGDVDEGKRDLLRAVKIAEECRELEDMYRAYGNLVYVLENAGRLDEAVALALEGLDRAREHGLEHTRASNVLANNACAAMVQLGRWDEAKAMIDERLPGRPATETLFLRLTLAEIAVGRGQFDAANQLLSQVRAAGGSVRQPQFLASLNACAAEIAIWRREYDVARAAVAERLDAIEQTEHAVARLRLYALGLRNEADEWQRRSDQRGTAPEDLAEVSSRMDDLKARTDQLSGSRAAELLPDVRALLMLCAAERGRADSSPNGSDWAEVADVWGQLKRPYQAGYARWREAEAANARRSIEADTRARADAMAQAQQAVRAASQVAESLGAKPLLQHVRTLAQLARLEPASAEPVAPPTPVPVEAEFHLTARERQVLALLCAGSSNGQIAKNLVVSRKTAATHVSNILKKLDVHSRGEAAAKAIRLSLVGGDPEA